MMSSRHLVLCTLLAFAGAGLLLSSNSECLARKHEHHSSRSSKKGTEPEASVSLAAMRMERPPRMSFDINFTLNNPLPHPRWFLLPVALPSRPGTQISVIEEHRVPGKAQITVGRTIGSWAYQIVKVPAKTTVKLHRLAVSFWGKPPEGSLPLTVTVASSIRIGDKPAEEWFSKEPSCTACSDVRGERLELAATQKAPSGKPLAVVATELVNLDLSLELSTKQASK